MSDKTEHPPLPEAFAQLGVRPSILKALAAEGFVTPSDIQSLLIPRALQGVDLLGQARTGTGKTAAFGIPILQQCEKDGATQAIILVPTRELAVQVDSEIQRLGQFTPIRSVPVYGGQKIAAQMKFLKHGPQILVGTPGRVIDLLDRRIINFERVKFVVLDEVDRMLDIGFRGDIRNILSRVQGVQSQQTEGSNESPADRHHQTIFVSATISPEIERLGRKYMREPVEKLIAPGSDEKPTVAEVEQHYFSVQPWDKYRLLKQLLLQENPELAIVFCKTKHGADKIAKRLRSDGIECREIHGNLAQNKRDRVMKNFRGGKFDVLIATDLASRGIDVADISHIVNYDIPDDPEVYVHRVGRTARMGAKGKAYTFVGRDQGDQLTKVEGLINMIIPLATLEGFTASPTPSDWEERLPGTDPATPPKPVVSRFERPYGATTPMTSSTGAPMQLPPRTIGSKIPINRRHKRR
jgi:ATP-dependent RNA helicase DeaD